MPTYIHPSIHPSIHTTSPPLSQSIHPNGQIQVLIEPAEGDKAKEEKKQKKETIVGGVSARRKARVAGSR